MSQEELNKQKIEKMQAIWKSFLAELNDIRDHRDEQIQSIVQEVEDSKIHELLDDIKNLKK